MAAPDSLYLSEPDPMRGNMSRGDITVQDIAVEIVAILEAATELEKTLDARYAMTGFGLIEKHQRSCDLLKKRFAQYAVDFGGMPKTRVSRRKWPLSQRLRQR